MVPDRFDFLLFCRYNDDFLGFLGHHCAGLGGFFGWGVFLFVTTFYDDPRPCIPLTAETSSRIRPVESLLAVPHHHSIFPLDLPDSMFGDEVFIFSRLPPLIQC